MRATQHLILPGRAYAPDVVEWEPLKLRQRGDGARREGGEGRRWRCGVWRVHQPPTGGWLDA
jgi:hypothetical protein